MVKELLRGKALATNGRLMKKQFYKKTQSPTRWTGVVTVAKYSDEFKRNAVSLFMCEGITRTSRQLHVTRATIYRWVRQSYSNSEEDKADRYEVCAVRSRQKHNKNVKE